ncbi:hypothetical protein [Haladaptatus sp. W1]|uniref:hypothetical protein n=1 Tax=Haladaptatus sp. W1 TaxID=1897478 RepID=UPI001112CAB3|nr:hypothetical protein [Haladaptatus sp. W1]
MSKYEYNTSKPDKLLTGYGTVRGAELKAIYSDINENTPLSQINARFGRPTNEGLETDHIDNCLRFLRSIDMIECSGQNAFSPLNRNIFPDFEVSFEPRLLYHTRKQTGRQSHLAAVHEVAIQELSSEEGHYGVRRVSVDDLKIKVDRATDYNLKWREEKIEMWANLLAPLGAISYSTNHDEVLLSPSRGLLHELLSHHQAHRENGESILSVLEWIDENFFPVFSRTGGQPAVHVGVADVLESLVEDDVLRLTGMSDRNEVVELPRSIDDSQTPADYTLQTASDRPSYWYPLDRSERRYLA